MKTAPWQQAGLRDGLTGRRQTCGSKGMLVTGCNADMNARMTYWFHHQAAPWQQAGVRDRITRHRQALPQQRQVGLAEACHVASCMCSTKAASPACDLLHLCWCERPQLLAVILVHCGKHNPADTNDACEPEVRGS
jgi:hypothetical protein